MNTCEDETEPLGESPDVPVRYDAGIGNTLTAIERGAVLGVLSAADKIAATAQLAERQESALGKIRARAHEALKYPRSAAYFAAMLREIAGIADEVV